MEGKEVVGGRKKNMMVKKRRRKREETAEREEGGFKEKKADRDRKAAGRRRLLQSVNMPKHWRKIEKHLGIKWNYKKIEKNRSWVKSKGKMRMNYVSMY